MVYKRFGNTYVVRVDRGEEVVEKLTELVEKENIRLARVEGLGAADRLTVGLYSVPEQKYYRTEYEKPLEITSLIGNVTRKDGEPYLHLHITCADEQNRVIGGHLNEVRIGATSEIFVTLVDGEVGRRVDDITGTGLNLLDLK